MARRLSNFTKFKRGVTARKKRVAKSLKRVKRAITKRQKRVDRYLKSNSLARSGRRKIKKAKKFATRATRKTLRSVKKNKRLAIRYGKKAQRLTKRNLKKATRDAKRIKRRASRLFRQTRKGLKRAVRITRKEFKRRSRAYQLRGKALRNRRAEQRQEIKGQFDTSRSVIRQASADPGASKPGEPPKMRTGEGRYSIKAEVRKRGKQIVSRTYVDKRIAKYMAMWEFRQDGKQRPFLKPGLMNNLPAFQTKVGAELKRFATQVAKRKARVN